MPHALDPDALDPVALAELLAAPAETSSEPPKPARAAPPALRYGGFHATADGREYTLSVTGEREPRQFVVVIPHAVFAARQASFQDAPALCYAKLQRALVADAQLLAGTRLVLSPEELAAHGVELEKRAPNRKRRGAG